MLPPRHGSISLRDPPLWLPADEDQAPAVVALINTPLRVVEVPVPPMRPCSSRRSSVLELDAGTGVFRRLDFEQSGTPRNPLTAAAAAAASSSGNPSSYGRDADDASTLSMAVDSNNHPDAAGNQRVQLRRPSVGRAGLQQHPGSKQQQRQHPGSTQQQHPGSQQLQGNGDGTSIAPPSDSASRPSTIAAGPRAKPCGAGATADSPSSVHANDSGYFTDNSLVVAPPSLFADPPLSLPLSAWGAPGIGGGDGDAVGVADGSGAMPPRDTSPLTAARETAAAAAAAEEERVFVRGRVGALVRCGSVADQQGASGTAPTGERLRWRWRRRGRGQKTVVKLLMENRSMRAHLAALERAYESEPEPEDPVPTSQELEVCRRRLMPRRHPPTPS